MTWFFDWVLMGIRVNEFSGRQKTLGQISETEYQTILTKDEQPIGLFGDVDGESIVSIGIVKHTCSTLLPA